MDLTGAGCRHAEKGAQFGRVSSGQVEKMLFPGVLRRQSIFAVPAGITENDCASDLWL
jgi:hypothetical protein